MLLSKLEASVAQWVKRWPAGLAVLSSSFVRGKIFSTVNGVPSIAHSFSLSTSYRPDMTLILLKRTYNRKSSIRNFSIYGYIHHFCITKIRGLASPISITCVTGNQLQRSGGLDTSFQPAGEAKTMNNNLRYFTIPSENRGVARADNMLKKTCKSECVQPRERSLQYGKSDPRPLPFRHFYKGEQHMCLLVCFPE